MKKRNLELHREYMPTLPNPHFEPMIEIVSNREALIEGSKGIVEYSDTEIDINCGCFVLKFTGFDLTIKSLSVNCISVSGKIITMNFLTV